MRMSMIISGLLFMLLLFPATFTLAQQNPAFLQYPNNHLKWYTIESAHFLVHFQEGNSRPAQVISRIAEDVYFDITDLYEYEPDTKISIVLIDREDYSNGAAYFFDNKIDIWLPSLDTPLRGTNNWLRDVISHEFTHIIQIQAALKRSRRSPVTYIQWLSYENVRRPDVLYGFPSGIITYPFSAVSMPAWLAEGTAQFQRSHYHFDYWDAHRDMILRTRVLEGTNLGLVEMGHFASKTSIEREAIYNQGFAFTAYLANRFGEESLREITRAFTRRGVHDVRTAIRDATGAGGQTVFNDFIDSLRTEYQMVADRVTDTPSELIESEGFFNFSASIGPDGSIYYLSNRGRDHSRLTLYKKEPGSNSATALINRNGLLSAPGGFTHSCGLEADPVINRLTSGYSVSPDGGKIAYGLIGLNRFGETYSDIHIRDTAGDNTRKITNSARISQPRWSPDGNTLAAIQMTDGTLNLVTMDPESGETTPITHFRSGEQVYTPAWHPSGRQIYFAYADTAQRTLYRFDFDSGSVEPVLETPGSDFRDPHIDSSGSWLYFAANSDGIFNIYRMHLETGAAEQMTDVIGGAFMPVVHGNELIYSEYRAEGYKIVKTGLNPAAAGTPSGQPDAQDAHGVQYVQGAQGALALHTPGVFARYSPFADDRDITAFPPEVMEAANRGPHRFTDPEGTGAESELYSYTDTFTSFTFFPTLRFDNYSQQYGRNSSLIKAGEFGSFGRNLWRDSKIGFYMSSREVLERFSMFGGALIGFGSRDASGVNDFFKPARLVDLDRDLFLIMEYAGLPFIKRHWSPTVSIGLYNLRRNVENGISIEEFPCTSCLPDSTNINIAYDIWQAEVNLYSKLSRFSLVELGFWHTPYRVSTEQFFSREFRQVVPGSTSRYFIGNTYTAAYVIHADEPWRHGDIAPVGIKAHIRYSYQPSRLLDRYDVRDGTLIPVYNTFKNHTIELDARLGFRALDENFELRSRFFTYFNAPDEFFFLDYIGGLVGMRSYPFFGIGGNTTAYTRLSYHVPLLTGINRQSGRFLLDKVFARLFVETGNGWGGPLGIGNNLKTGIGAELRVAVQSSYLFPSRFFISGAYGLDRYGLRVPEGFITTDGRESVSFGRELLINFGLLFDFDF
jgi:Tol biopolymer transport system component